MPDKDPTTSAAVANAATSTGQQCNRTVDDVTLKEAVTVLLLARAPGRH
jgi:hypothetical protein